MTGSDFGLLEGADHLLVPGRSILNLWTETEECHIGHLHLLRTARRLLAEKHAVTFYVGEFQSDLWAPLEFGRREQSYKVVSTVLKALVPGADAHSGFHATDKARLTNGHTFHNRMRLGVRTQNYTSLPVPPNEIKDALADIYKKPWGGLKSQFFTIFSIYAADNKFDSILIAERHAYIGKALAWFAHACFRTPMMPLLVVRNVNAMNGKPMSRKNDPVRMQEPTEYLRQALETNDDQAARRTFIKQLCELFLEDGRAPDDFKVWWEANVATLDAPDAFALLTGRVNGLFEDYRNVVYSVLPETQDETHRRINNLALLGHVGLAVKRWNSAAGGDADLPAWARNIDPRVNDESSDFEGSHYAKAFEDVESILRRHENAGDGLSKDIIQRLLRLASENRTTDLFLFFGSRKQHRDHYVHTFNVCGLGQFMLDLYVRDGKQLKDHIATELECTVLDVEVTWWLTAMLHDHAYPLHSMMEWMSRLQGLAKAYPSQTGILADLARSHAKSIPLVHDDIRNPILAAIDAKTFGLTTLWDSTKAKRHDLFWFLDDADLTPLVANPLPDHGFAAVLNIVCHLQECGPGVRYKKLLRQILRGILFHTNVKLRDGKVSDIQWRADPMAYLLLVCDELQEWSRRTLRDREGDMKPAQSELLLAPLRRRLESDERWTVPKDRALDVTVRYFDVREVEKWDSHAFHRSKNEMFSRLRMQGTDPFPRIRLLYALATPKYPLDVT